MNYRKPKELSQPEYEAMVTLYQKAIPDIRQRLARAKAITFIEGDELARQRREDPVFCLFYKLAVVIFAEDRVRCAGLVKFSEGEVRAVDVVFRDWL